MKRHTLYKANKSNVIRLAKYLNLQIDGFSHKQIVRLISWRLHPNRQFFDKRGKHECSHDSCWKNINIFPKLYFEMANCINSELIKDQKPSIAPNDMNEYNTFARNTFYEWVSVKVIKDPEDERSYRRLIILT